MRTPEQEAATIAKTIGGRLRAARETLALSRAFLGERAGVDRDTVLRVENGRHSLTLRTLVRLCRALGLDAREVVGRR